MTTNKLSRLAEQRDMSVFRLIEQAIAENGSVKQAAAALGVKPQAIRYRLDQAGKRVITKWTTVAQIVDKEPQP